MSKRDSKAASNLVAQSHATDGGLEDYRDQEGRCCFCSTVSDGVSTERAISAKYFTDNDLMAAQTGHVCQHCAYCMNTRELKQGHWLATESEHRRISTGDLQEELARVQRGDVEPPLAMHISEDPIRSEHAYLWTPISDTTAPLTVDYAGQRIRVTWPEYEHLLDAVEELRWHGFRGDDIRSGEARVSDIERIGADRYLDLDDIVDPYRGTAFFELIWTVSKSKSDQDKPPEPA